MAEHYPSCTTTGRKEGLSFSGEGSPMARRKERQREGIALAKKRGAYRGRKPALSPDQITRLKARINAGEKRATIGRETLYQYLRQSLQ